MHEGIQYDMVEKDGVWTWSFQPIYGPRRFGKVDAEYRYAVAVVERSIETSMLINAA